MTREKKMGKSQTTVKTKGKRKKISGGSQQTWNATTGWS